MTDASPRAPLSVETDLELTVDGVRADVRSTGERLFVEFPSLLAAVRVARSLPMDRTDSAAVLTDVDVTIEIRSRGRTVAAVGPDAPAGPLSRSLDVDPAQVRLAGVLAAVGQELAAAVRTLRRVFG